MKTIISENLKETKAIADQIAQKITGGEIIALFGNLGSGKTTFTQFLAKSLGIEKNLKSPTFVIVKQYPFEKNGSKLNLIHIDAYRLESADDLESIGFFEMLEDKNNIIVIEWPEKIKNTLPSNFIKIFFEYVDENRRQISIEELK